MQNEHIERDESRALLSHRIRNLEQENLILKRYLSEIPQNLGSIIALDCDDTRRSELDVLHGRLNRFCTRISAPDGIYGRSS